MLSSMAIGAMARGEHGGAPARTVLLVTPHLGLVDQWLRARLMDPSLLPADEPLVVASQTDEDVTITTDADEIGAFLERDAFRLIISTYASLPKVAQATRGRAIDFAVFDEAHVMAGIGPQIGLGLDDARLRARYRLFLTATPRTS